MKAGVFNQGTLIARAAWECWSLDAVLTLATNHRAENVILSEVGSPISDGDRASIASGRRLIALNAGTPLPFRNLYATPQTLGKDRVAAVAGALARFLGQNCLVIDAGTCITYDVLTADGDYLGGNISPGIGLRFRALPVFTAGLPIVEAGETAGLVGNSTETAIRHGVQLGALWEMQGAIEAMQQHWERLNVLLTGGDAEYFAKNLKTRIFASPDLVLEGLNKILTYNV